MEIDLEGFKQDAIRNIESNLFLVSTKLDWETFYRKVSKLCDNFLIIATANLLADLETPNFFQNLCRLSENWRRLLYFADTHYKQRVSLSKDYPIHAAVIVQQKALLDNLSKSLPKDWVAGEEAEDRFYVNHLLLALSSSKVVANDDIEQLLVSLEACEKTGDRTQLVKALLLLDDLTEEDFWSSFDNVLQLQQELIQNKIDQKSYSIEAFLPHSKLWFEGMAWLRLAQIKGFTLPNRGFVMCPEESFLPMAETYQNDWVIMPDVKI